jgi:Tol biopolymer transport system component/Tfp pilus assembly protein PilF
MKTFKFNVLGFFCLVVVGICLTACGSSSELTYRVSGEDITQASITYTDTKGNLQEEQVDLPWETTFDFGGKFDAEINVTNEEPTGTVTCEIWLDGRELGKRSSVAYASCVAFLSVSRNSSISSFVSSSVETYLSKAQDYLNDGELDKALAEVEHAIEVAPDFPSAYFVQGLVYKRMDDLENALAAYTRTIELDPEYVQAYNNRGQIYQAMGDLEAAIADWTTAIELNPEYVTGYYNRATAYIELGDFEAATADVLKVQELSDDPDKLAWAEESLEKLAPIPESAAGPETDARIVFASRRDGNTEIYTMNADGSNLQRLTDNPALDSDPVWSPDGERIAFVSERDGNPEIYLMDADGSNVTRLTDHPAVDQMPAWAPNSKVLVFVTERNGNADLYLLNIENGELNQLTKSPANEWYPTWSPDEPEVAFVSDEDGDADLYIINSELKVRRLTDNDIYDGDPNWSANGRFIVFSTKPDADNGDLYSIRPDGTGLQQITEEPGINIQPAWSPDNNYIAFTSNRDGNPEIYVLDEAGDTYRLTDHEEADYVPRWGPPAKP